MGTAPSGLAEGTPHASVLETGTGHRDMAFLTLMAEWASGEGDV
jgi:hypothetical protein